MLPSSLQKAIDEISRLPGIGPKSAQRIVMNLLQKPKSRAKTLGSSISEMHNGISFCQQCWFVAETNLCPLCSDEERNQGLICIVENILDLVAIERTKEYKGVYHVLHGVLSPINGVSAEDLKISELLNRVTKIISLERTHQHLHLQNKHQQPPQESSTLPENSAAAEDVPTKLEIILATNPGLEGEATAMYLQKQLSDLKVKTTRIARGIPIGANLEYADQVTLIRALADRRNY